MIWFIVLYQDQILSSNIYPDLIRKLLKSKKWQEIKSQEILQHHKLKESELSIWYSLILCKHLEFNQSISSIDVTFKILQQHTCRENHWIIFLGWLSYKSYKRTHTKGLKYKNSTVMKRISQSIICYMLNEEWMKKMFVNILFILCCYLKCYAKINIYSKYIQAYLLLLLLHNFELQKNEIKIRILNP